MNTGHAETAAKLRTLSVIMVDAAVDHVAVNIGITTEKPDAP